MDLEDVELRRAERTDVDDIAPAHRDSIASIGPSYYPPQVVSAWQDSITGTLYLNAMDGGEVFFIATASLDGRPVVLGFASDYRIEGSTHGTSVYVRGIAARRGLGSRLLHLAEAHAIANGATSIRVEASLPGVEFYKAKGFTEIGRGETRLTSGHPMACVFMRKDLAKTNLQSDDRT